MGAYLSHATFDRKVAQLQELINNEPESIVRIVNPEFYSKRKTPIVQIGHKNGKLTVTGYVLGKNKGLRALIVKCDCGRPEYLVDSNNYTKFKSTKCNYCAQKSTADKKKLYWGYADIIPDDSHRKRLLNRIAACLQRCHNPNDSAYPNYGGRGINVFQEWRNPKDGRRKYLSYLVTLEGWDVPEYELDRIDCDKGYEPGNLRFITRKENMLNKRSVQEMQQRILDQAEYILELEAKIYDLENMLTGHFDQD